MRFKLDENLPRDVCSYLAGHGHDVDTVLDEQLGGHSDTAVVKAASTDDRMLLTLDRGVGDLRRFRPGLTQASSYFDRQAER